MLSAGLHIDLVPPSCFILVCRLNSDIEQQIKCKVSIISVQPIGKMVGVSSDGKWTFIGGWSYINTNCMCFYETGSAMCIIRSVHIQIGDGSCLCFSVSSLKM